MEKFLQFIMNNKYPIIGCIIALIMIATGIYEWIIPIALIVLRNLWRNLFSEK